MIRKDFIQREIDKIGKMVAGILDLLLGTKSDLTETEMESVSDVLQAELNIDLDGLLSLPDEGLVKLLTETYTFSQDNLKSMADLYYVLGKKLPEPETRNAKQKSLIIYQYLLNSGTGNIAFEIPGRVKELKRELGND